MGEGAAAPAGPADALTARYVLDETLLRRSVDALLRHEMGLLLPLLWIITAAVLAMFAAVVALGRSGVPAAPFGFLLLACLLVSAIPRVATLLNVARLKRARGVLGSVEVMVRDGWFEKRDEANQLRRRLDVLHGVRRRGELLLVELAPGWQVVIPAWADFGALDFDRFATELERRVSAARASARG